MVANIHFVPTERHGWPVEVEGTDGPASLYPAQEEAIATGIERAKKDRVELFVHGRDGQLARAKFLRS